MKLTERQRELNNAISKIRCLIERTFGSIRRWFSGGRCRYRGLERTHTQNILEAMAYNLKRMPRLLVLQSIKYPRKAPSREDDPPERGQGGETGIPLLSLKTPEFRRGKCTL